MSADTNQPMNSDVELTNAEADANPGETTAVRNGRNRAWKLTIVFAVLILPISLLAFMEKLVELSYIVLKDEPDGAFALTPLVNYLLASAGFFLLILGAAVNGMFNDLEKPKHLMLENELRLDAAAGE